MSKKTIVPSSVFTGRDLTLPPLPKPTATFATEGTTRLTVENIRGIICNPIYTGIPPYPALISDEQWIAASKRAIEEDGIEQFLVNMLTMLRTSLEPAPLEKRSL